MKKKINFIYSVVVEIFKAKTKFPLICYKNLLRVEKSWWKNGKLRVIEIIEQNIIR